MALAKLLLIAASLDLMLFGASVKAFSLTPITLEKPSGILQIRNGNSRSLQVRVQAYPARVVGGSMTAALEPFSPAVQESLVRLRPQGARILSGSTRNVSYRILDPNRTFYLCATTQKGTFLLRICSRWPGLPASASPSAPRPRSI